MRVLVLTQRLPYAPNRGDRLRAFHQIRFLRESGCDVRVLALVHDDEEASHVGDLESAGVVAGVARVPGLRNKARALAALPGATPLTCLLLDSPELPAALARVLDGFAPDVVLACSSSMAAIALRERLRRVPLVIDLVDVDSEKWRALAASTWWPLSWIYAREHRTLQAFEGNAGRLARMTFVVTDRERDALHAFAPDVACEVLQNGIDVAHFAPAPDVEREPRVVFTGVMNYAPNVDAAMWLAREIWPRVRARHPRAALDIVGASPTPGVQALADAAQQITVTGSVPDVRPYLWRARAAAAPLRVARGIQNKVLEAAAAGVPCVVTSPVRGGLPDPLKGQCPVADDADAFAAALVGLLDSPAPPDVWRASVAGLSWNAALARLPDALRAAAARSTTAHR